MTDPAAFPPMPDFQAWVARHGGYHRIPWPEWDEAVAAWDKARKNRILDEGDEFHQPRYPE